jgi:hypothetical protein
MSTAATEATAKLARERMARRKLYPIITLEARAVAFRHRLSHLKMVMQVRDVVETTSERIRLQWLIEEMAVQL